MVDIRAWVDTMLHPIAHWRIHRAFKNGWYEINWQRVAEYVGTDATEPDDILDELYGQVMEEYRQLEYSPDDLEEMLIFWQELRRRRQNES